MHNLFPKQNESLSEKRLCNNLGGVAATPLPDPEAKGPAPDSIQDPVLKDPVGAKPKGRNEQKRAGEGVANAVGQLADGEVEIQVKSKGPVAKVLQLRGAGETGEQMSDPFGNPIGGENFMHESLVSGAAVADDEAAALRAAVKPKVDAGEPKPKAEGLKTNPKELEAAKKRSGCTRRKIRFIESHTRERLWSRKKRWKTGGNIETSSKPLAPKGNYTF